MKKFLAAAAIAAVVFGVEAETRFRNLPAGYTQLEWLKGDGNQWIDTGLVISRDYVQTVLDFSLQKASGSISYGSNGGGDSNDWRFFASVNTFYFDVGNKRVNASGYVQDKRFVATFNISGSGHSFVFTDVDGAQVCTASTSQSGNTLDDSYHIGIFGGTKTDKSYYCEPMTVYSLTIATNTTGGLIRDYVPAKCEETGFYGLYDVQNSVFYTNSCYSAKKKDFTAGSVVVMNVDAALSQSGSGWSVNAEVTDGSGILDVIAVDESNVETVFPVASGAAVSAGSYNVPLTGLAENTTFTIYYRMKSETAGDDGIRVKVGTIFTGGLTLVCERNADEGELNAGRFLVKLGGGATAAEEMTVNYTVEAESTAIAGQTYVALSGSVTIPKNGDGTYINVVPKWDPETTEDTTVVVKLAVGDYNIITTDAVSLTIKSGESFGGWLYDIAAGTITDGKWQFACSTVSGLNIYVADVNCDSTKGPVPTEVTPIDWSKKVLASDALSRTIHTIGYCFYRGSTRYAPYVYIGEVTMPSTLKKMDINTFRTVYGLGRQIEITLPEGLEYVGEASMASSSSISIDASKFPSTVTFIGPNAFNEVDLYGDLELPSLVTTDLRASFCGTKLTSVKFGPNVTGLWSGSSQGPLRKVTTLTNVVFEADEVLFRSGGCFLGCTSLKEVDLSCAVYDLATPNSGREDFYQSGVEKVIYSGSMTNLPSKVFSSANNLKQVIFTGSAPMTISTPYLDGVSKDQSVTTYIYKAYADTKQDGAEKAWRDYAADGVLDGKRSTWDAEYLASDVTDLSKRRLVMIDYKPGMVLLVR